MMERNRRGLGSEFTVDDWLDERVAEMARIWDSAALGQGSLLMQALVLVRMARAIQRQLRNSTKICI
jgi:hypothetical protein